MRFSSVPWKRLRRGLAAAVIVCGLGAGGVLAWRAYWADDLLANATRITSVKAWMLSLPDSLPQGDIASGGGSYRWISDRRVLFFHDLTATEEVDSKTGRRWGLTSYGAGHAAIYDTETRRTEELAPLTRLLQQTRCDTWNAEIAPDRTHLMWTGGDYQRTYSASLDGSEFLSWTGHSTIMVWLGPEERPALEEFRDHANWAAFRLPPWRGHAEGRITLQDISNGMDALGASGDNRIYFLDSDKDFTVSPPVTSYAILVKQIGDHSDAVQRFPVRFAVQPYVDHAVALISANRICWLVEGKATLPIDRLLQRFAPHFARGPRPAESIWTSRLDGSGLRLEGSVPVKSPGDRTIHSVQWLPSGRRVSFVYHDVLYTVPVD